MTQVTGSAAHSTAKSAGRVLVVEDEPEIRDLIELHLGRMGLSVETSGSAEEATEKLKYKNYDLAILDWMLPGMSGVTLAKNIRALRKNDRLSILMVTARAETADIVEGLEGGADDYLTKPFEAQVLVARVKALLRRAQTEPEQSKAGPSAELRAGGLVMNTETYESKCNNEPLSLTPSEFKLLVALIQNRGRVLTRDSLIECVQGEGVSVVGRTVDTHVFGLRKKLGDCAEIIETVRGVGYRVKYLDN